LPAMSVAVITMLSGVVVTTFGMVL
jgi:hypothetical protein